MKHEQRLAEEGLSIRVGDLYARGAPAGDQPLVLKRTDPRSEVVLELTADELGISCLYRLLRPGQEPRIVQYRVAVSWTDANLAGKRAWLHCAQPDCQKRSARLFLEDPYLVCRGCAGVRYTSQVRQISERDKRSARIREIRRRLGGIPERDGPRPARPKGMHESTYQRFCSELAELEGRETDDALAEGEISFYDLFLRALAARARPD